MNPYQRWLTNYLLFEADKESGAAKTADPVLDAISQLGSDVKSQLGTLGTQVSSLEDQVSGLDSRLSVVEETQENQEKIFESVSKLSDLVPLNGPKYSPNPQLDVKFNSKTELGFSDEQNQAFSFYMSRPNEVAATYKWCQEVGLTDPHIYEYEYSGNEIAGVKMTNVKHRDSRKLTEKGLDGEIKQLSGLTPAAGGVLIPQDHLRDIIAKRDEISVMRPAGARIFRTGLRVVDIPVESTKQAKFTIVAENVARPTDTPNFTAKQATVNTWAKIILVTEDLAMDEQSGLIPWLMNGAGRALGLTENEQFFVGTGNGTTGPEGAVTATTVGPVTAASTAITVEEVLALYYANTDYLVPGASWVMNPTIEQLVRSLKDQTYAFIPVQYANRTDRTTQGRISSLLERNLFTTQEMATLAVNAKIMILGDFFSGYLVIERMGMEVRLLRERYADMGQVGYRFTTRFTGLTTNLDALRVLKGAAT